MSSEIIKMVFQGVKKEVIYFAGAALKSGAGHIGNQLVNVTRDENQTSGFQLETLANALKSGIMATGQDLITVGLDRVKSISPQDQASKVSEESTWTQQSVEEE